MDPGKLLVLTYVMKDRSIKIIVKFPRTRISDSTRLVFPPGAKPGWYKVGAFPKIQPPYEIPREVLSGTYEVSIQDYTFKLDLDKPGTYDEMVIQIIKGLHWLKKISPEIKEIDFRKSYLYGIQFNKNRTASLLIDYIDYE